MTFPLRALGAIFAGAALLSAACSPPAKPAEHPVTRLAPFDLDCPKDQLHYTHLANGMWGVSGCGRRTKYVRICRQVSSGMFVSDECQWVQN